MATRTVARLLPVLLLLGLVLILLGIIGGTAVRSTEFSFISVPGMTEGRYNLYLMDVEHRLAYNLTKHNFRNVKQTPAWSPDGKKIAYVMTTRTDDAIYIHDLTGGDEREIRLPDALHLHPHWSPDGKQFIFTAYTDVWGIYSADLAADPPEIELIETGLLVDPDPSWSPDSGSLVYIESKTNASLKRIAMIDLTTGETRTLSVQYGLISGGSWSPDGQFIVFSGARLDYQTGLFLINTETYAETGLNNAFMSQAPQWSQQENILAWRGDNGGIYVQGKGQIAKARGGDAPQWSPDGTRLLYMNDAMFVIVNADGSDLRVIDHRSDLKINPLWRP